MKFSLIAAMDQENGIGKNGDIPWYLPEDLQNFQYLTTGNGRNAVIMGRVTWESIPKKYRPLKNRLNIVITRQQLKDCDYTFMNLDVALKYLDKNEKIDEVFIIGGQGLYQEGIEHQDCNKLYLTHLDKTFGCDRFFPDVDTNKFVLTKESMTYIREDIKYKFVVYENTS
jgi:dihydrofolate reductase